MIDDLQGLDPQQLAKEAKEKLEKQKEEIIEENSEDLYSGFRDEDGQTTEDMMAEEDLQSLYAQEEPLPEVEDKELDEEYMEAQEEHPDIDEFEEQVCPGGPLKSEVAVWKKQFPKSSIHIMSISNKIFVFRTVSRPEYKRLLSIPDINALQREEIICHTTMLYPYDFDYKTIAGLDAGIPSTLADVIMEKSGFTRNFQIEVL